MRKKRFNYLKISGLLLMFFYISVALNNQIIYTFKPFLRSYRTILRMLSKDDLGQLKEMDYPVYSIMNKINSYPEDINFYFLPCFEDSNNSGSWWYLYIRARYLCYPRKIFVNHPLLHDGDKKEYIRRFIGNASKYSELEWIKSRGIKYIILLRNNVISILPIDSEIIL